jgi:hypothetical protein
MIGISVIIPGISTILELREIIVRSRATNKVIMNEFDRVVDNYIVLEKLGVGKLRVHNRNILLKNDIFAECELDLAPGNDVT